MNNCQIRYAKTEDYSAVENIMRQVHDLHIAWRPDVYKECNPVLPQEELLDALDKGVFVVAEADGEVVGVLSYMYRHVEANGRMTKDTIFIDVMAVDENYRGKGIGHRLFDFVKELVKEKDLDGIELQVNARNTLAKKMYESYGFTEKSINMELQGV